MKISKAIFSGLFLLLVLFSASGSSSATTSEEMIEVPKWKWERLDYIFQEQETELAKLLSNSQTTGEDYKVLMMKYQNLEIQLKDLMKDASRTEEDLKKYSLLLEKAEASLKILKAQIERERGRHKNQKWFIGALSGAVGYGLGKISN